MADALMIISSDHRRGAETFAVALGEALEEWGHRSTVVAIRGDHRRDRLDVAIAGRSRWDPIGMARLVALARRNEVVVGHGSSALLGGCAAASLARRPFIYRNIGDPAAWGDNAGASVRIGAPLRRAAGVAALYDSGAAELRRRYRLDVTRVRTIPNAASTERFRLTTPESRRLARERFGLDENVTWLGCVGALSSEKRVELAIDLVVRDPGLGLLLAGDGPARSELEERVGVGAAARVIFVGSVDDVLPVYDAVDVLYLPSRTEGLPAVAIEAGLCGLPVVASPVGGLPEIIDDGITGRLVDPTDLDAAATAVADAVRRRADLGAAARRRVEKSYSMDAVAGSWSALIEDVLTGFAGGSPTPGT